MRQVVGGNPGIEGVLGALAAAMRCRVRYVNHAFTDLTGYSAEEVLGKSPSFLQGSETDETVVQRLHADMAAGQVFAGKAVNYRKDFSTFTMWWRVMPVTGSSGHPAYFVASQRQAPPE